MPLTHYVIVRRDLPIGFGLAQLAHAAGESFYQLEPPVGFKPHETRVVVLGARNHAKALKLRRLLEANAVAHVPIHDDVSEVYELTAIGIVPTSEDLRELLREHQTFTRFDEREKEQKHDE